MRTMHPTLLQRTFKVHGTGHWTYAYRVIVREDYDLAQRLQWRLTPWSADVDLDIGGTLGTVRFTPYGIAHTEIATDLEGSAPTFDVIIDNTTHQIGKYAEQGAGYSGMRVEVYLFNVESAGLGFAAKFFGYVQAVGLQSIDGQSNCVLSCSMGVDLGSIDMPHESFEPHRCRHREYARGRCGAIVIATTPLEFQSCGRTWFDCLQRRDYMLAYGLPERLPHTFGGQPGIPIERGVA